MNNENKYTQMLDDAKDARIAELEAKLAQYKSHVDFFGDTCDALIDENKKLENMLEALKEILEGDYS